MRVIEGGQLLPTPFYTVVANSVWERGLVGLALDPNFGDIFGAAAQFGHRCNG